MARSRRTRSRLGLVALVAACAALPAPAARGADRVYWANAGNNTVSFANLDGSGGGTLNVAGAVPAYPFAVAVDSAAGRIYWANVDSNSISFANLDGSGGGGTLNTSGASVAKPQGLAIDPVGGWVYWSNFLPDVSSISFARLDGRGGGGRLIAGADALGLEAGLAVDPAAGRIWWGRQAIFGGPPAGISFTNLDGTGGTQSLDVSGATLDLQSVPNGVAVDSAGGRVYWATSPCCATTGGSISFAALNGSGGGDVNTAGATVERPFGVAVDHAGGRIYWANFTGNTIAFAALDGSGAGGTLNTTGTTLDHPSSPVLVLVPRPVAPPAIAGASRAPATLSCSQGSWAPDVVAALLYEAPQRFAYQWSRNGREIPGATASTLSADPAGGDYRCRATAANAAGSAIQESAAHHVAPAAFGRATHVALALSSRRVAARGSVLMRVVNANPFPLTGTLSGMGPAPRSAFGGLRVKLRAVKLTLAAHAKRTVKLSLPRSLRRVLASRHTLSLALTATVRDPAGHRRTVKKTVTPKLAAKARRHRGS